MKIFLWISVVVIATFITAVLLPHFQRAAHERRLAKEAEEGYKRHINKILAFARGGESSVSSWSRYPARVTNWITGREEEKDRTIETAAHTGGIFQSITKWGGRNPVQISNWFAGQKLVRVDRAHAAPSAHAFPHVHDLVAGGYGKQASRVDLSYLGGTTGAYVLGSAAHYASKALFFVAVAQDTYAVGGAVMEDLSKGRVDKSVAEIGAVAGGWSGAVAGASIGASVGSVIPVAGTLVGSVVGGIAGHLFGGAVGRTAGEVVTNVIAR